MNTEQRLSCWDRWVLFVALVFLLSETLGGALRYGLSLVGFHPLIYVPKMLVLAILLATLLRALVGGRINGLYLGALVVLGPSALAGLLYTTGFFQVSFGLYVLSPLLFGIVAYPTFRRTWPKLKPYVTILWLVAATGVLLNSCYVFPWEGFSYHLAGLDIEASRKWTTIGIKRVAGFSRASFDAAIQIFLLGLFLIVIMCRRKLRVIVWMITGVTIALTTMKTIMAVYLAFTILLLFWKFVPRLVLLSLPTMAAFIGIMLPLSTLFTNYQLNLNDSVSLFLFRSFGERLSHTWPVALELIQQHGTALLGRGIGGIGTPQKYFEVSLANPADNIYVYLYAIFGIGMLFIISMYAGLVRRLSFRANPLDAYFYFVVLAILIGGLTTNVMESAYLTLFAGLSVHHLVAKRYARICKRRG